MFQSIGAFTLTMANQTDESIDMVMDTTMDTGKTIHDYGMLLPIRLQLTRPSDKPAQLNQIKNALPTT